MKGKLGFDYFVFPPSTFLLVIFGLTITLPFLQFLLGEWSYFPALVYREVRGQPQSSTPGTGTFYQRTLQHAGYCQFEPWRTALGNYKLSLLRLLRTLSHALCVLIVLGLHILLVCFFLIKLVRQQYCISSPHWVLLWVTTHRELIVALWPPSEEHWPIALESQEE